MLISEVRLGKRARQPCFGDADMNNESEWKDVLRQLGRGRVVLASKSPRRKEIMEKELGFERVSVFPSGFAEDLDKAQYSPFGYVMETAQQKALDVYRAEVDADEPPIVLISADTIVLKGREILEKPRGVDHHVNMLKSLRDSKIHKVYTAVCCIIPYEEPIDPGYAMESAIEETTVVFRKDITDEEILAYVASGEASDAAGGYKVQGEYGKKFIENVEGDYHNVVGLPVNITKALIAKTLKLASNANSDSSSSSSENDDNDDDDF